MTHLHAFFLATGQFATIITQPISLRHRFYFLHFSSCSVSYYFLSSTRWRI